MLECKVCKAIIALFFSKTVRPVWLFSVHEGNELGEVGWKEFWILFCCNRKPKEDLKKKSDMISYVL